MTLFYDPIKRKPKPWALGLFIILPIIVITVSFIIGQGLSEQKKRNQQASPEEDIFQKKF